MPLFDHNGFHPDMLPTHLKKDAKELISYAVILGWKCHLTTNKSVTIIAPPPNESKKYHFGLSGRNGNNLNRVKRDVIRFADPERLMLAAVAGEAGDETGRAAAGLLAEIATRDGGADVIDQRPEPKPKPRPAEKQPVEEPASSESEPDEKHLLFEKPMLAKASDGEGYESQVALERHWSDGSIDYKCVDCDYSSPNRLSIRSHRTKRDHQKREAREPRFKTDVPDAATYAPRQTRVEALAALLAEMQGEDPEAIARAALTWVHEQSRRGTGLAEEREPMTAEETLERIKALVDSSGERLAEKQKMAEMEERIAAMEAQIEQTERYAIEQAERADRSQATLNALRELVTEVTVAEAERKAG